ncbi:hypothetical protein SAMN04488168_12342 [Bacillus sp. 491mf]|uniref:conjugal transfer protein TrbL family protein n=1 Tax=Bacillus sp. 491mf TaxID=1761755 RepID=UPI0008E40AFC|nr:conjugal transfer protein TrbL family protein [Bacillus sp. 491mf]SFD18512.1 hypothetical protein SAMN04488168_12342 [Bacillus sp. 491mf]
MPNPGDVINGAIDKVKDAANVILNPIDTATNVIKGAATKSFTELLTDITKGAGESVLKWINWFLLDPQTYQNPTVDTVVDFFKWLAVMLAIAFMIYHVLQAMLLVNITGDRTYAKEKVASLIQAMVLIAILPWVIEKLLQLCEGICKYFTNKGIDFEHSAIGKWLTTGSPDSELAKIMGLNPQSAVAFIAIFSLAFVILFLVIAFQALKRMGEFAFLVATSPIAAISLVNNEMNAFPVWWREMLAVIFTQVVQVVLLYLIVNCFATLQLKFIALGMGLCLVLISGPTYLRQFLYSTGSGKAMVGAIGSMGKVATAKFILRGGR